MLAAAVTLMWKTFILTLKPLGGGGICPATFSNDPSHGRAGFLRNRQRRQRFFDNLLLCRRSWLKTARDLYLQAC